MKIKALDEGIVGIVFRAEEAHFYILEISNKFIRIRKKVDENYFLLTINETLGYDVNIPFLVLLTMNNDKINAFITKGGQFDTLIKVFEKDVIDSDIKFGGIGLSTFKTRAYFEDISMEPMDLTDEFESNVFIDETEDPLIKQLPKIKDSQQILDTVNHNVSNYSWNDCLRYPMVNDRRKYCSMNFSGGTSKASCVVSFFLEKIFLEKLLPDML